MENKVILRNSSKISRVQKDLKERCRILENAFTYLAKCDIIDEACPAEDMTKWARQMVCGDVSGLKQHLRDGETTSIFDRIEKRTTEKRLAEFDRDIDNALQLYESGIQKSSMNLYRYWANVDAAQFIYYKDGCILFDSEQVEHRYSFSLDSEPQLTFIKKAREVQQAIAAFDKMCNKLGLLGISNRDSENAVVQKNAYGVWWLDLRLLAGIEIRESDVETIETSSLDNVRECSYELSDL